MDHRQLANEYRSKLKAAEQKIYELEAALAHSQMPSIVKSEDRNEEQHEDLKTLHKRIAELEGDVSAFNDWLDRLTQATDLQAAAVVDTLCEIRAEAHNQKQRLESAVGTEKARRDQVKNQEAIAKKAEKRADKQSGSVIRHNVRCRPSKQNTRGRRSRSSLYTLKLRSLRTDCA